ncbi:MAG: thiamine pyrophosphate-dependent enzyme, partial [Pigmentiphaga sp.]
NGDLNLVTWEQRVKGGDPRFEASQCLPEFPYADYARMLGLEGIRVEEAGEVASAMEQAVAARTPIVVEVMADPEIPPMPPHIGVSQFAAYMRAMRKDAAGGAALRATLKQWWAS